MQTDPKTARFDKGGMDCAGCAIGRERGEAATGGKAILTGACGLALALAWTAGHLMPSV